MNEWLIAATVLTAALLAPAAVCALADAPDGLAALEVAGTVASAIMILLAEGLQRQPFVDLAVVLAPLSLVGALVYARLMERHI
jgi:multisubunit Na+/H+ antiporter MnhF subunit